MGDPLVSIETRQNKIRIEHFSGSAWRNSHVALFEYNDENREWYLAELQTASFHASNPDDIRESLLLHGDQLDYLSLQDYDIDKSPAEQIN